MFGIFVFSADGKDYPIGHPLKKKPQEALSLTDEEIIRLEAKSPKIGSYSLHWSDEMDKDSFEKCYSYFSEKLPVIEGALKSSKKGYIDEGKKFYFRKIVNDKRWFKEAFEL